MDYISNSYVINMDKSTDRLKKMQEQQYKLSSKPFIRIKAVVGKELSEKEKQKYSSYWYYRFGSENTIGCFLSHKKAWQTMIDNNDSYALIMEDDCEIIDTFKDDLQTVIEELNDVDPEWDFLYAGCFGAAKYTKQYTLLQYGIKMVVPTIKKSKLQPNAFSYIPEAPLGFHCYIISQKCAKKLLKIMKRVSTHMDAMFLKYANMFNVYASKKQLAYQFATSHNSTISEVKFPHILNSKLDNITDEYNIAYSFYFNYPLAHISKFPINYYLILLITIMFIIPSKYVYHFALIIAIYLCMELSIVPNNYDYILFWILSLSFVIYIKKNVIKFDYFMESNNIIE